MHKITKTHFEYFKKRCQYWVDVFGLKNWHLFYSRHCEKSTNVAELPSNLSGYVATIFLNRESNWPVTKDTLDYSALHEIVHLTLSRYRANANARFVQECDIAEAEEEAVRTLCSAIRSRDGKGR